MLLADAAATAATAPDGHGRRRAVCDAKRLRELPLQGVGGDADRRGRDRAAGEKTILIRVRACGQAQELLADASVARMCTD